MLSAAAVLHPPESPASISFSRAPHASPPRDLQDADDQRNANFLAAFTTGRFSDMIVIAHDHVYRLHRVVLMQSPFFRRLLLDENGAEVVVAEGSLGIEVGGDWRVVREGMDISLRDLYMPASHRNAQITPENVLAVLPAACFLELSNLAAHCVRTVLASLSADTAVDYATQLERLRLPPGRTAPSPYGPKHAYAKLFGQCLDKLCDTVLGFLCGVINAGLTAVDGAHVKQDLSDGPLANQAHAPQQADQHGATLADDLLSRLPLCWVRRVLESDLLCVPTEHERYELVKRVVAMRRVAAPEQQPDQPAAANDESIFDEIHYADDGENDTNSVHGARDARETTHDDSDLDVSLWSEDNTSRSGFHTREGSVFSDVVARNAVATEGVFRLRSYVHSLLGRVVSNGPAAPIVPTSTPPGGATTAANRKRKRRPSDLENIHPTMVSGTPGLLDDTEDDNHDQFVPAVEELSTPVPRRKAALRSDEHQFATSASSHRGRAGRVSPPTTPTTSTTPRRSPAITARPSPAPAPAPQQQQRDSIVHTRYGPGSLPQSARDVATREDTVMAGVFQTAIVYTHMTFPQLELVKTDGIVPDAVVLESFWMQAELMSGRARDGAAAAAAAMAGGGGGSGPRRFGKFRFCVPFRDVREFFMGKGKAPVVPFAAGASSASAAAVAASEDGAAMASNTGRVLLSSLVVCAGLQYRVLLSVAEDDDEDRDDDAADAAPDSSPVASRNPRRGWPNSTKPPQLRALLQRNRVGDAKRPRGAAGDARQRPMPPKPPISYRIHIFRRGDFVHSSPSGGAGRRSRRWDRFVQPVTQCEFNGEGFVDGFAMPEADEDKDLWALVVIEFR
ncbi:hypothetical protein HDU87_006570 [Geranomyces variabilis]|uniref:BTB domain-containing protein n=1 Tax=Geranomyces variabilis TaxID=109894 RepID=A0AAD5XQD3_9FUNG|nr:hypothetical protein HDU87_006570 [Geranomyces variabilis]